MNSAEIAKLAQVSRATVSRVLNGHSNISPKTREKVERIIQQYNYFPDEAARRLAGKSNRFLALFVIDFSSKQGEYTVTRSPYFYEFVSYAIDIVNLHGYNLVTTIIHRENIHDIDRLYQSGSIAGGIIMGDILEQSFLAALVSRGYKMALLHQIRRSPSSNILTISEDNYKSGYLAGELLLKNGHQKIAHITGEQHRLAVQDRLEGFINALTGNGVSFSSEQYLEYGDFYRSNGDYHAMMRLLKRNRNDLPSALFIASIMMKSGALKAIEDFGLRIPEDLSIVVMNDIGNDIHPTAPLSAITLSVEQYTKLAVTKLIELIENNSLPCYDYMVNDISVFEGNSIATVNPQKE